MSSSSTPPVPHVDVRTLYVNHHAWLLGWLRKRMRHGDHAADLAHDIFVQILGKPEQLQELRQPRAWLSTVAHGLLVDRVRRQRVERAWLEVLASRPEHCMPSEEHRAMVVEALQQVQAMLERLPRNVAEAFMLAQLQGLSYQAIAEHLGVSARTVTHYMSQAMFQCLLLEAELDEALS